MRRKSASNGSVALASLAAGPIFLVSTALAVLYLRLPHPITADVGPRDIALIVLSFIPAIFFGFLLSIIPNLIGSRLLLGAGGAIPATRARPIWIGAGALFGAAIAAETGTFAEPAYAFGLIFTSASCAAICRLSASWD